ncbi:MAG: phospho-N-acetylmuramoyl-pentapeptide-transferase [bacterium]
METLQTLNFDPFVSALIPVLICAFAGFVLAMLATPIYTHFAFKHKAWKIARTNAVTGEAAPVYQKLHAAKHRRNIPTMAGIVMIVVVGLIIGGLRWLVDPSIYRKELLLPLFSFVGAGCIGLFDDYINIRGTDKRVAGLRAPVKLALTLLIALIGALYFFFKLGYSQIHVPAVGNFEIGLLYIPLFMLVIVSTANAVNISDGLDGLSGGLSALAYGAFAVIAFFQGLPWLAAFCATVVGVVLAYTWFNIYPARFFMGDSGSFALGTGLGVVAMLTNSVFTLPIIGIVFVIEAGSSVVQIISKRYFGRKIFLSAPIHHHLEAIGWPETKVTMRLWVIGAVAATIGLMIGLIARG